MLYSFFSAIWFHDDWFRLPKLLCYVNHYNFKLLRINKEPVSLAQINRNEGPVAKKVEVGGGVAFAGAELDLAKYKKVIYKRKAVLCNKFVYSFNFLFI